MKEISAATKRRIDALARAIREEESQTAKRRMRLVRMILSGEGIEDASEKVGVHSKSAYEWRKRYRESGIAGLRDQVQRGGKEPIVEMALVKKEAHILYKQNKLTPQRLSRVIARKRGHEYGSTSMRNMLRSLGYEVQSSGGLFKTWQKLK